MKETTSDKVKGAMGCLLLPIVLLAALYCTLVLLGLIADTKLVRLIFS
jgi:hypothetical protein